MFEDLQRVFTLRELSTASSLQRSTPFGFSALRDLTVTLTCLIHSPLSLKQLLRFNQVRAVAPLLDL
ncbi:MAG TPA: hypothetical protein VIR01_16335 [Pyrinomonadaceae bacterium]